MAQIVAQPQAARFITAKLWNYFAGQPPSDELNDALADVFRENGNNFKPFLRVMFRSEEFYDPAIVRNQVKSPVQWLVGTARMLECDLPPTRDLRRHHAPAGAGFVRAAERQGLGRRHHLDHHQHAAGPLQRCGHPRAGRGYSSGAFGSHAADEPDGRQARRDNRAKRVHVGGVDVEKILSPEERADKDRLVAALQHRLLQSTLKDEQAKRVERLSQCAGQIERRGHSRGHPPGDVHAGISSDMKVIRHSSSFSFS